MRSHTILIIILCILLSTPHTAFSNFNNDAEYIKLIKLERKALSNGIGKVYIRNITGRKDCNKTRVKYLGIARTKRGKQYKILTSFFVFSASATCHGTSRIKIFDMQNRFIGEYNMGMPDALPDTLTNNRLIFSNSKDDCIPRKKLSINFGNGIPRTLIKPCSTSNGEIGYFSSSY